MLLSWLKSFFKPDINDLVAQSRKNYTEEQQALENEWRNLFIEIKESMHERTILDPEVQRLADRWLILLEKFHKLHPRLKDEKEIYGFIQAYVPEEIRNSATDFKDPSAFIQKVLAERKKQQQFSQP